MTASIYGLSNPKAFFCNSLTSTKDTKEDMMYENQP